MNVYYISSIHYIFGGISFFLPYFIQSSQILRFSDISDFQCSLYFCKIFYYFCYILLSMELVKKYTYISDL
jgi:hypothetical protein